VHGGKLPAGILKRKTAVPSRKKAAPVSRSGFMNISLAVPYFFFAARFSSIAACAAARRATGTR
jgi:hypothetical protein